MVEWLSERSRSGGVDEIPLALPTGSAAAGGPALPEAPAGRLWLCGKHFIGPDAEAALRTAGADVAVCLCEEEELAGRYPSYVGWLRANRPDRAVWFPVPDLHAPRPGDALDLLTDLRGRLHRGQQLLMHCGAGIGRAGTMAAALLMTLGLSKVDAVHRVGTHRPMAGPEAGPQATLLDALERALAQSGRPPEPI